MNRLTLTLLAAATLSAQPYLHPPAVDTYATHNPDGITILPNGRHLQPAGSHYPLERARFVTVEAGKHVDIFLINASSRGWRDGVQFEAYLKSHPAALERYCLLKEAGAGLSTRAYYRRKIEFINEILTLSNGGGQGEQ